jgi:hypothetical protein
MRENVKAGAERIGELVDEFDRIEERVGDFLRHSHEDGSVEYVREDGAIAKRWTAEEFTLLRSVHELA